MLVSRLICSILCKRVKKKIYEFEDFQVSYTLAKLAGRFECGRQEQGWVCASVWSHVEWIISRSYSNFKSESFKNVPLLHRSFD